MYKVISTFCGIGGSSQGYKQAGLKVVASVEFLDYQARTYRANHPTTQVFERDIRGLDPLEVLAAVGLAPGELDIFDGSPPCSSFSTMGSISDGWGKVKQYGNTEQRTDDLFLDYVRFLRAIRPKVFVAENVSGLIKGVSKGHFNHFFQLFTESQYRVSSKLMNAANYGVPQKRQRLIFVGVRNDLPSELLPVYPTAEQCFTPASIIDTLPPMSDELRAALMLNPDTAQYKHWHNAKAGQNFSEVTKGNFSRVKLSSRQPAPTLTTRCMMDLMHWAEPRCFSIDELKLFQSLPVDYQLTGSRAEQCEGIGRSVPPKLMQAVATTIARDILDKL